VNGAAATSPQASLALVPWGSGKLQFSWGQYAQFPDVGKLFAKYGDRGLRPERATHYVAAWEQRLGDMSRIRITAYERRDRDLLFRPAMEARLAGAGIVGDDWAAPITNSMRGYTRGLAFFVQRRSANRLTGWMSYALGYTRMRDSVTGLEFPGDQDQRHTANVYMGYRVRPSVNLSVRWAYGSGFPIAGFFRKDGERYFLSSERNRARLGPYQSIDVRVNKSRTFNHCKVTIYGEVVNLFNRTNQRFDSYNGFDGRTGEAYLSFSTMFPILPTAGVMVQF
jgi:outer membrane cobalamin receptor